ncbi:hypothetical protein C5167_042227 [Papaver somniferum]|uniref:Tryptophanyl-tRNA synthetase n=1 Tax=Papaver somniferum TaxID=3469 RepID=A0A4Y7L5E5_PAPSO|nr:hypothetical protein C5167_042227 [Papaver somniferum]
MHYKALINAFSSYSCINELLSARITTATSFETSNANKFATKIDYLTERLQDLKTLLGVQQVPNHAETLRSSGRINYDKLVDEFGCQRLDETLIDRLERVTKRPAHVLLRRGKFFAHRDLNLILDAYEKGDKYYLYTERGPSSEALHLGHLIPFLFTKYLQDAFKVPLVIQLTDDAKYVYKNLSVEETKRLARENAKDIIACGFDISRTFIFSDFGYVGGGFYENAIKVLGNTTGNQMHGTFGITLADPSAKFIFPGLQAAPSFPDVAPKLGYQKPALIESSFLPALHGDSGKMSASIPNSAAYVTDSAENIKSKVNKAHTGGGDSLEKQQERGANLDKDIPFKYLEFFVEYDAELEHIKQAYGQVFADFYLLE